MAQTPRSSFRAQLRRVAAGITRAAPLPRGKRRVANMVGDWLAAPQQSEPRIVRMAAGFSLHVDLSSKNQRRMYFSGLYEPNVTRLFQTLLTTGDTVIDGGANIGYYSLLSSQCVGAGGAVHAFEPVPSTFGALEENIRLNTCTNIAARQMAISDNSQGLTLELPTDERTGNFRDWAASSVILGQGPLVEVPSCSLDEYTADRQIEQIKLVKLDLEGAELSAIKGMQRLLGERRVSLPGLRTQHEPARRLPGGS